MFFASNSDSQHSTAEFRIKHPITYFIALRHREIGRGMTLAECIGRYSVRKSLRFGLTPVAGTENFVYDSVYASEELAECLNPVKEVILAKHIAMVRRVFAQLPDPLPDDPKAIVRAFRTDPEFSALDNPNAFTVLKSLVDSCRYKRWPVPPAVKNLLGWSALYMKWHWHCIAKRKVSATEGVPVEWAGKRKEEVLNSFRCRARRTDIRWRQSGRLQRMRSCPCRFRTKRR
jgi:hypothetical protein